METVKFGFDRSVESDHAPLTVMVPTKVQETLDYTYAPLLRKISKGLTSGLSAERTDVGKLYRIDSRAIGQATLRGRVESLSRTMQLILAVQHAAVRHKMIDPRARLHPTVSLQNGFFPLVATLDLGHAVQTSAKTLQTQAYERMVASHRALLNPHGNVSQSAHLATAQVYPELGILLGVGHPRDVIKAKTYGAEQTVYRLEGLASSHEHSLLLMVGAVALAETAQLATA